MVPRVQQRRFASLAWQIDLLAMFIYGATWRVVALLSLCLGGDNARALPSCTSSGLAKWRFSHGARHSRERFGSRWSRVGGEPPVGVARAELPSLELQPC